MLKPDPQTTIEDLAHLVSVLAQTVYDLAKEADRPALCNVAFHVQHQAGRLARGAS